MKSTELTAIQHLFIRLCKRLEMPTEQAAICLSALSLDEQKEVLNWAIDKMATIGKADLKLQDLATKVSEIIRGRKK